ncbi:MAG TPA: wax ester/triacylglycerol synthase domain-containing protein, partial [Acidimicrobiales bacterium]|nr:wax ester/triacylglycerol synthase domain-containing protein [Acidimicrobiales bacterium]
MDDQAFTDRLTASDNLLWQVEADPVLRTPVLVVGLLDRSPSPERVEASVERAAAIVPRLGQRLAPPPLGLGRPRWRPAGEPSLAQHVRRVRAPGDDLDAVLAVAEPDAVAAFDPARPLWTMTIVDGLAGGRAALLLRFHHTLTDGVGGMDLADMLFDRARRPRPAGADVDGVAAGGAGPSTDHPPGGAPALLSAARLATSAARHPARVTAGAVRLGRSAARLLSPA